MVRLALRKRRVFGEYLLAPIHRLHDTAAALTPSTARPAFHLSPALQHIRRRVVQGARKLSSQVTIKPQLGIPIGLCTCPGPLSGGGSGQVSGDGGTRAPGCCSRRRQVEPVALPELPECLLVVLNVLEAQSLIRGQPVEHGAA
eukprot:scaffold1021_cov108-Isochrysis_galbana.AAC.12